MNKRLFIAAAIVSVAGFSLTANAASRGHRPTSPRASATVAQTVITSVTATSVTINDGTTTKTLMVSPVSEITVNGQKATLADLKAGMTVSVVLSDPTHASRIAATSTAK